MSLGIAANLHALLQVCIFKVGLEYVELTGAQRGLEEYFRNDARCMLCSIALQSLILLYLCSMLDACSVALHFNYK